MVSYAETQRHANRMKCRRSMHGTSGHGNRSWDEEEEDEDAEEAEVRGRLVARGLCVRARNP